MSRNTKKHRIHWMQQMRFGAGFILAVVSNSESQSDLQSRTVVYPGIDPNHSGVAWLQRIGSITFRYFCGPCEYIAVQFCFWSRVGGASKNLETKPTVICVCALDRCRLRNACACVCQFVAPHSFGCHYCWSCQNPANCSCLAGSGRASLHYQMR